MPQFAVIKTGGKQYIVYPGQKLKVEKLATPGWGESHHGRNAKENGFISFDQVLLMDDGKKTEVGTPNVKGIRVEAKVLQQGRAKKVIVFKYHSKSRYRKKKGHRQPFTEIEILKITA